MLVHKYCRHNNNNHTCYPYSTFPRNCLKIHNMHNAQDPNHLAHTKTHCSLQTDTQPLQLRTPISYARERGDPLYTQLKR